MRFLLTNFFQSSWFLVIVLIVAVVLLFGSSFYRRKKDEQLRNELNDKIVKGAKVRTFAGVYGVVVSTRNTTDGKIVLIETGEGNKKSYQQIHVNAIYGIDDSEELVIDAEGNEVPLSELNKPKEETDTKPAKESTKGSETTAEEVVEESVEETTENK